MSADLAIKDENLKEMIFTFRNVQVMIDTDLAVLYKVETKALNQAVKRNLNRFPDNFRFQLSEEEKNELVTDCDRLRNLKHSTSPPYAFTEQGVAMLSAVLKSEMAVQTSIRVINAFVEMRHSIAANGGLLQRMNTLEKRQIAHEVKTEERFEKIFSALEEKSFEHVQGIFFDGQIFDAYVFINDLLRQARKSIVLIDNFIDDSVLMQLSKRSKSVWGVILTKSISARLRQDLKKHNAQYPPITILEFTPCHDRFLILDGETVYHIGASLKDLGKKWFAFSRMQKDALVITKRVEEMLSNDRI